MMTWESNLQEMCQGDGPKMDARAWMVTGVPPLAIMGLVYWFPPQAQTAWQLAGLMLAVVSLLLLTMARLQLGDSFSVHAEAKQLVTWGLYSRIRNPIYVFSTLVMVGFAVLYRRPACLLWLLVLVPVQWSRAKRESEVLEQAFGEDYRRYKAKTWF